MLLTTAYNSSWSLLITDSRGNQHGGRPVVMAASNPYRGSGIKWFLLSFWNQVQIHVISEIMMIWSQCMCDVSRLDLLDLIAPMSGLVGKQKSEHLGWGGGVNIETSLCGIIPKGFVVWCGQGHCVTSGTKSRGVWNVITHSSGFGAWL